MSTAIAMRRYDGESVRADAALQKQLAEVYADAFSGPPYHGTLEQAQTWATERLVLQFGYPAFHLVTAERDGRLIGFSYGVLGAEDQWFTQMLRARLPALVAQTWLGAHGELVELAVRSEAHGHGLGGALHDAVVAHLRDVDARTALLVADAGAVPARALYASRGWQDIAVLASGKMLMGIRLAAVPQR